MYPPVGVVVLLSKRPPPGYDGDVPRLTETILTFRRGYVRFPFHFGRPANEFIGRIRSRGAIRVSPPPRTRHVR